MPVHSEEEQRPFGLMRMEANPVFPGRETRGTDLRKGGGRKRNAGQDAPHEWLEQTWLFPPQEPPPPHGTMLAVRVALPRDGGTAQHWTHHPRPPVGQQVGAMSDVANPLPGDGGVPAPSAVSETSQHVEARAGHGGARGETEARAWTPVVLPAQGRGMPRSTWASSGPQSHQ